MSRAVLCTNARCRCAFRVAQAMALAHSPGVIEVACNLLDPEASPPKVGCG